jgi:poly(A) polymerase
MEVLGVPPGPVVGRAYQHLLQVRLDAGVIGEELARAELLHWWSQQPESGAS